MLKKYQNIILFTATIIILFISSVLYMFELWGWFLPFTIAGTLLFWMMYVANNLHRLTKLPFLTAFTNNMYFWGVFAFVLLLAHEAKFSYAMHKVASGDADYTTLFFQISIYLFLLIIPMAVTSFERYRPRHWKVIQRVFMWGSLPLIFVHLWQVDYYFWAFFFLIPCVISLFALFYDQKNRNVYITQIASFFIALVAFSVLSYLMDLVLVASLAFLLFALIFIKINPKMEKYHSLFNKLFLATSVLLIIFSLSYYLYPLGIN